MKIKTFISLISLALCIIVSFGCLVSSYTNEDSIANSNQKNIPIVDDGGTRYISNFSSRSKSYDSFEELVTNAQYIISGKCVSSKPIYQNQTLYTLSKFIIIDSYKGDMEINDVINIIEIGGRTTFGDFESGCGLEEKTFEKGGLRLSEIYNIVVGNDGFFPLDFVK